MASNLRRSRVASLALLTGIDPRPWWYDLCVRLLLADFCPFRQAASGLVTMVRLLRTDPGHRRLASWIYSRNSTAYLARFPENFPALLVIWSKRKHMGVDVPSRRWLTMRESRCLRFPPNAAVVLLSPTDPANRRGARALSLMLLPGRKRRSLTQHRESLMAFAISSSRTH